MRSSEIASCDSPTVRLGERAIRVCVTPTRNESWIINKFVSAASCWADHIVVADQGSTDGTLQELQDKPGVRVVRNESKGLDEKHRQELLLSNARKIPGRRILFGLDADETLSANSLQSREWERILAAKPGTILRFRWANILPGFEKAWIPPEPRAFGFVDDGSEHNGRRIHSPRVPQPDNAPILDLEDIVVLHFQYVVWDRMLSKQRWYQTWERLNSPRKGPLQIYREYNHMFGGWGTSEIHPVKPEWLDGYFQAGIDFRTLKREAVTWWDREIVQLLQKHGAKHFCREAIWDEDWKAMADRLGVDGTDMSDPRSPWEKFVHRTLAATQGRRANWGVRAFERLLRTTGW